MTSSNTPDPNPKERMTRPYGDPTYERLASQSRPSRTGPTVVSQPVVIYTQAVSAAIGEAADRIVAALDRLTAAIQHTTPTGTPSSTTPSSQRPSVWTRPPTRAKSALQEAEGD